jgi:hypothetical protein
LGGSFGGSGETTPPSAPEGFGRGGGTVSGGEGTNNRPQEPSPAVPETITQNLAADRVLASRTTLNNTTPELTTIYNESMALLAQGKSFLDDIVQSGFSIVVTFYGPNDKPPKISGEKQAKICPDNEFEGAVYFESGTTKPASSNIDFATKTITINLKSEVLLKAAQSEGGVYYYDASNTKYHSTPAEIILHEFIHQLLSIVTGYRVTPTLKGNDDQACDDYASDYNLIERYVETVVNMWQRSRNMPENSEGFK